MVAHGQAAHFGCWYTGVRVASRRPEQPAIIVEGHLVGCMVVIGHTKVADHWVNCLVG